MRKLKHKKKHNYNQLARKIARRLEKDNYSMVWQNSIGQKLCRTFDRKEVQRQIKIGTFTLENFTMFCKPRFR